MSMSLACGIACDLTSATGLAEVGNLECRLPSHPSRFCLSGMAGKGCRQSVLASQGSGTLPFEGVTAASWAEGAGWWGVASGEWPQGSGQSGSLKPNTLYLPVSPSGAAT